LLAPIVTPPVTPTVPIAAPVVPPLLAVLPVVAPTSTLIPVVAAINTLTTPAAVANAVAQLAPSSPNLAAGLVTFEATRELQNLWLSRMDDIMCSEVSQPHDPSTPPDQLPSTCRDNDLRGGGWVKAFGYGGSQGSQTGFLGYDVGIYGTMMGYDVPIDPGTRLGWSFGYARSQIDGKIFTANTDANTYQGTAYVTHEEGPWYVQGDTSFGWNDYSGSRNISLPGLTLIPKSNYSGQSYTGFVTTGYHFFNQGFTITPLASLQYTHVDEDGYSETGAGDVNLKVNSQSYDFLESTLGVKVAHPYLGYFGNYAGTYVPEMHFKWLYELVNPTLANTAAFTAAGSPSFTTPGLKAGADTLDLGVGLQFLSCQCTAQTWSVEAVYDHLWRTRNYSADQGMVRLTARF
jgi:outer membrane autotransporter protein